MAWRRSKTSRAGCGYSGGVQVVGISENSALLQHPFQSAIVVLAKALEVIVSKLVNYDCENQARSFRRILSPCDESRDRE